MWRYFVGLLATVGALALLSVGGLFAVVTVGPLSGKSLPKSMVLSLDLRDVPSESSSGGLLSGSLFGKPRDLTYVLETLWQAADDPRVAGLFVDIGDETAGMARVQELRQAIARFRGKGKFAIGFAEGFGGSGAHISDYYLATALEQIWLQPSGSFATTGLAIETPFIKEGLDKLGVRVEGGKRLEYKSAPDTFTSNGYTPPARENLQQLVNGLFGQFVEDAARDRRLEASKLRQLIDGAPLTADQALKAGLVDKTGYRSEALDEMWRRAPNSNDLVTLGDYAGESKSRPRGDVVALVRASGAITSGTGSAGPLDDDPLANSDDIIDALLLAAQTKEVKAIVLRIDSPGGTYPAADALAAAVKRARESGKPVVVSMGDVAASGGYLAAVHADVIVAEPTTITGSIGVFGIWPVTSELLASLGVKVEQVGVGANAGMYSFFRQPTPQQRAIVDRELDIVYADFTKQVRESRKLDAARLDAAARGRVFTGVDAKKAGLVDELGGLALAISIARAKAGIDETRPIELRRFPADSDRLSKLIDRVFQLTGLDSTRGPSIKAPREVRDALARVGIVARPGNVRLPPLPPLWR
jgi:protease-4